MSARASVAVISLCSTPRLDHLRNQLAALRSRARDADDPSGVADVIAIVVWIGGDEAPALDADRIVHVPPGRDGLRLAAARNAGAAAALDAGAELLVFLDADCVPGPALIGRYRDAALRHPDAVLCGPVTYLPPGVDTRDESELLAATAPHAARPDPADGGEEVAGPDDYRLFWSLSFAMTAPAWSAGPRFDEGYEGYGGEDTDFAYGLRESGMPLVWVGGAHAYHQHHPTQSPPWQHLDDILRNGARFAERWGSWPMTGWLEAFESAGAIVRDGDGWRRA